MSGPTTGAVLGDKLYIIINTGIHNLEEDKIVDPAKLEWVAVVALNRMCAQVIEIIAVLSICAECLVPAAADATQE